MLSSEIHWMSKISTPSHEDSASYVNDPKSTLCRHWNHWMLLGATFRLPIFTMLACHVTRLAACMRWIVDYCSGSSQALWTFFSGAQERSTIPDSILQELAFLPFFMFGQLNDSNQEGEGEMDRKTASFFVSACTCIKTGNPEIEYNQSQFCEMQFKHHAAFPNIPGYMRLHGRARNVQCMCTVFLRFSGPISLQPIVALSLELFLEFVVIRSSSLARWPAVPPGQQNTQVVKSQSRHGWHWVTKGLCDTVAINSTAQTTTTSARSICLLPHIMCSGFQFSTI